MPGQAPEEQDRRRTPMVSKATAGGVTLSVGLLLTLMQQGSATSTQVAELVRQRTADQAQVIELTYLVREMRSQISSVVATYDRRLVDGEREIQAHTGMLRALDQRVDALERHQGPASTAERQGAILGAIARVNPAERGLWTQSGQPTVAAVRAILGGHVSQAEISSAWQVLLASSRAPVGDDPTASIDP